MAETFKMLIVDEDPSTANLLKTHLSNYGLADIVGDAETAINTWKREADAGKPYSVIFIDLMLSGVGGHVAAKEIRKLEQELFNERRTNIIIVSGIKNTTQTFYNVLDLCDGYIGKPFTEAKVRDGLAKIGISTDTPSFDAIAESPNENQPEEE
ncbi:MAG: response regulator [Planctomycetes bacterium]|nr:response regulator [Planctomycetota bacterium]